MTQVLVTHPVGKLDLYFGQVALDELRQLAKVILNPFDRELSTTELAALANGCDALIAYRGTPGTAELFDALPRLKAFVRCATDIRTVDVDAAGVRGILVTRTGAGFGTAVAEWVIGCMVALCRQIPAYAADYHAGRPPRPAMGRELRGSVLGVIGYGLIGREVCRLAAAFGMRIVVTDPHALVREKGMAQVPLDTLLRQSDIVVCLAAATADTENLMNARTFEAMKHGAFFINAARGSLVDEQALLDALECGQLAGCALDVGRAPDQMPSEALARHPLVIATPHVGGLTRPATDFQALETVRQVGSLLAGRVPEGAVNAALASRCTFPELQP